MKAIVSCAVVALGVCLGASVGVGQGLTRVGPAVLCQGQAASAAAGSAEPAAATQSQAPPDRSVRTRLSELSQEFQLLARRVSPSVVRISAAGYRPVDDDEDTGKQTGVSARQQSSGSGVIIDPAGYIVTNAHVVLGAQKVQVTLPAQSALHGKQGEAGSPGGRRSLHAELVGLDLETDIALLRVSEKGLPALALADSDAVEQGEIVWAFGSPLGLDNSVSMGVVSSTARQFKADDPMVYLQTDASINPGNSGGPVVDADGRVVGLSTLILSQSGGSEGLGFAVPSNIVANVVDQLRATGKVVRGEIGVVAQSITPALAEGWKLPRDWGVVIADVDPESEAAHAGLRAGDVIQSLNARQVESARQFNAGIYRPAPGAAVRLSVLRAGAVLEFKVKVKEKNDAAHFSDLASHEENLIAELGIFAVDLTDALRDELGSLRRDRGGILVAARDADAPALEDYFQSGDVIYALNRETVKDVEGLRRLLKKMKAGDAVAVQIERSGHLRFVAFELP